MVQALTEVAIDFEKITPQEIFPGFQGKIFHTNNLTIARIKIKAGAVLPKHAHPNEQISVIIEGEFQFNINGQTQFFTPNTVAVIPANAEHSGRAITDCLFLETFCPVREDLKIKSSDA